VTNPHRGAIYHTNNLGSEFPIRALMIRAPGQYAIVFACAVLYSTNTVGGFGHPLQRRIHVCDKTSATVEDQIRPRRLDHVH
jgi:hypothetical protein